MGDLNIHIDDLNDPVAQDLLEVMGALGMSQHVTSATHNAGHILDHIYTETNGEVQVLLCENKDYISDHCAVLCQLNVPKENIKRKTITFRKYKDINYNKFAEDCAFDCKEINDLHHLVNVFETKAGLAIDKHAPEKTKTLTIRKHHSWFTDEVHQKKCIVRKKEKIWKCNKCPENWQAFREERNQYHSMIRGIKMHILSEQIIRCKGDIKSLYRVFNDITGQKRENPMPEEHDEKDLQKILPTFS